jgi:hypothetical protein
MKGKVKERKTNAEVLKELREQIRQEEREF